MEFRHQQTRFEAIEDDHVVGWLDFEGHDDGVALTHTIVPAQFAGRGIGGALVHYGLTYAREHGWAVLPYCTFIQSYIATHEGFLELVPEDRCGEFNLRAEVGHE